MRRLTRLTRALVAVLLAAAVLAACGGDDDGSDSALETRTVEAGEVTVEIVPLKLDSGGAKFELTFDTHSVELDFDVASVARLIVAGVEWRPAVWEGDPPGGHHREGTLSFEATGDGVGTAELRIDDLPAPVSTMWDVSGS